MKHGSILKRGWVIEGPLGVMICGIFAMPNIAPNLGVTSLGETFWIEIVQLVVTDSDHWEPENKENILVYFVLIIIFS